SCPFTVEGLMTINRTVLILAACLSLSQRLGATTLTFDDLLTDPIDVVPSTGDLLFTFRQHPYDGLLFTTSSVQSYLGPYYGTKLHDGQDSQGLSGQHNGVVSGPNVLIGATQGLLFQTQNSSAFTVNDFYLTALDLVPLTVN